VPRRPALAAGEVTRMTGRIVSLIPSATEIVCALGLRESLVGVSHECDYPKSVTSLPVVCEPKLDPRLSSAAIDRSVRALVEQALSVYRVRSEVLSRLAPDLIVTQHQCEVCAVSEGDVRAACATLGLGARICSLEPECLGDIAADFVRVAAAAGVSERGSALVAEFHARLDRVAERARGAQQPRLALVEWLDPPMIAGGWMPELARVAGAEPVIVDEPRRFRTVDYAAIDAAEPEVIVVMPCGFDVTRTLADLTRDSAGAALFETRAARAGRLFVLDGNAYFNRPGPRIAESAELLAAVVHPERFEWAAPAAVARFDGSVFRRGEAK
jgi:iron complex transport system substrate-binding protein